MNNAELVFDVEERHGIQVVRVSGPLDSMTYDRAKSFLDAFAATHTHIILDCRNLTYINSRGLTLLIYYQRRAKTKFCFFGLAGLSPRARKGLELLGLNNVMACYPTTEEAMAMAEVS